MKLTYNIHAHSFKISLALLLMCSFAHIASAASAATNNILTFPGSKTANIGIIIRDLSNGDDLISRNPDKQLTPASILKCVTAASVLLDGRENDNFVTESFVAGNIDNDGKLWGNLVVKGVGDPTTESPQFPEYCGITDSIASRLNKLGIREICGDVQIDSLQFKEAGPIRHWETDDLQWYYGAGLYPVNYHDNTQGVDRSIRRPVTRFIKEVKARLAKDSITISRNGNSIIYPDVKMIYAHQSPSAAQIMRIMLEQSNNLYAESMLRFLAPLGTIADALAKERTLLNIAGLNTEKLIAYDGSGLTRNSKLTPAFMADLLETMSIGDKANLYLSLFPKAGLEGTVKKLLKDTPLAGKLLLKSGSMKGVQCFAGYKINDEGKPSHVVVIMVNDFTCQRATVIKAISNMLLEQFKDETTTQQSETQNTQS